MGKISVLNIKNLTFGYDKGKLIYKNFNLSLYKGEIKAIVGESGSGKSTLFELILGNLIPFQGIINKSKVSVVFQDPYSSFHPSYSIISQIQEITNNLDELDVLLTKLKLDKDLIYNKPKILSGGQLQRCSILRALLFKPDLLLIDEPTSALDNIIALDMMKLLISYLDQMGIVLITHDLELAKWCSDEIVLLH
jgi:peptide/nickel transport system ATP-binding protein